MGPKERTIRKKGSYDWPQSDQHCQQPALLKRAVSWEMLTGGCMSQRAEIRSLTGLRGAAAVFVAFYHSFYFMVSNQADNSPPVVFLRHGYLSVDLFFVLSGYVMALTYAPLFAGGFRMLAFADFLGRRIGRIYPAYITVTAFVALYSMQGHSVLITGFQERVTDRS